MREIQNTGIRTYLNIYLKWNSTYSLIVVIQITHLTVITLSDTVR